MTSSLVGSEMCIRDRTSDRVFVLEHGKIQQTFEHGQISAADIREALHDENDR